MKLDCWFPEVRKPAIHKSLNKVILSTCIGDRLYPYGAGQASFVPAVMIV